MGIVDQLLIAADLGKAIIADILTHKDPIERRALLWEFLFRFEGAFAKADLDVRLMNEKRDASEKVAPPARNFRVIRGDRA